MILGEDQTQLPRSALKQILPARGACVWHSLLQCNPAKVMKNCSLLAAAILMKMEVFSCWFCAQNETMFSVGCAGFLTWLSIPRRAVLILHGSTSPGDCRVLPGDQLAEGLAAAWLTPPLISDFMLALPGFTYRPVSFFLLLRLQISLVFWSSPATPRCKVPAVVLNVCPCSDVSLGSLTNGLENVMEMWKSII